MAIKKNALGRGLSALIDMDSVNTAGSSSISEVELSQIEANPNQPRTHFDEEALAELSASIKQIGVVQPITLREIENGRYQIVAGERRFRAAGMAGLTKIPAYVKTVDDESMMEMALVENIQREDLNAIEIALTYQRLIEDYKFTQEALSDKVGKKRATIANYLRLLRLPAEVQLGIKNKLIDMGHARALVSLSEPEDMIRVYEQAVNNDYSVRQVEELVHKVMNGEEGTAGESNPGEGAEKPREAATADFAPLCEKLSRAFGTKVSIARNAKGRGKITLQFSSDEEFEKLLSILDEIN